MIPSELKSLFEHPALAALLEHVSGRLDADPGHGLAHVLRVALWTRRILQSESKMSEREEHCVIAAALLHDIVNVPKNHPDRARASELCAEEARRVLPAYGFSSDEIAQVAVAIVDHSFSRGAIPSSSLGRALQDADRLEAVGAIGIMRTFSTGARMGAEYFHADDPWATERARDDIRYSIDHFFTKLLGLAATMQTPLGRQEGEKRTAVLRAFLSALGHEIDAPAPQMMVH